MQVAAVAADAEGVWVGPRAADRFSFRVIASLGEEDHTIAADAATENSLPRHNHHLVMAASVGSGSRIAGRGSSSSGSSSDSSSNGSSSPAVAQRPKGAVLEVPDGLSQQQFVKAVTSAREVRGLVPDRVITLAQGR